MACSIDVEHGFPRRVAVLGATGSIGLQALDVIRSWPDHFQVVGLAAGRLSPALRELTTEFGPERVAVARPEDDGRARPEGQAPTSGGPAAVPGVGHPGPLWSCGDDAVALLLRETQPDVVINAIPGLAGLLPALAALERPVILGMASKEPIVAAGSLLHRAAKASGARLVPVDSEPAGVAQCLAGRPLSSVERIVLTASGGPFWGRDPAGLADVGPAEALRHPRWSMGPKISVDSATLFNKGLEAIEIAQLFGVPLDKVDIMVHRQSVVHAMVEFCDGSIQAQLGPADMRVPIAQALFWPRHAPLPPSRLGLDGARLEFDRPDLAAWPCLGAALAAGRHGGLAPAVISAADEVLVAEFLRGKISFGSIGRGLWAVLDEMRRGYPGASSAATELELAAVLEADRWARDCARRWTRGLDNADDRLPLWAAREGVDR